MAKYYQKCELLCLTTDLSVETYQGAIKKAYVKDEKKRKN